MNQNTLILLLVALANTQKNHTYMNDKAGDGHIFKTGLSDFSQLKTHHIVSQLYETIDALKRVEQISKLADFSTIRKRRLPEEVKEELRDDKDTYIGGIRESFGNVRDFLGNDDKDEAFKAAEHPGPPVREPKKNNNNGNGLEGLTAIASLLGGGGNGNGGSGISQEALMSMIGNLMGSMGGNSGGKNSSHGSDSSFNGADSSFGDTSRNNRGGNGASGGLDFDKLMKMVSLISTLNKK